MAQPKPAVPIPYFDDIFSCQCYNDYGYQDFENFWKNSGSCCDNLRLTIWIIFNFILFIVVTVLVIKIREEKRAIQRDLEDFEPPNEAEPANQSDDSSVEEGNNRPLEAPLAGRRK